MAATIQNIELPKKPRALDTSTSIQEVSQEILTNGDLASAGAVTATSWSLGWSSDTANVTIASNQLVLTKSGGVPSTALPTDGASSRSIMVSGNTYSFTYTVADIDDGTNPVSSFVYGDGTSSHSAPFTVDTHTITFVATGSHFYISNQGANSILKLDDLSLKQVDTFSNNNHGKIYSGRALEFDGVTDHLTAPLGNLDASASTSWAKGSIGSDNIVTNATGREVPLKLTSCVWVRLNAVGKSQFIQESGGGEWGIKVESSNKITVNYLTDNYGVDSNNDHASATGTKVLEANTWYRVVVNYNMQEGAAADVFQIYINGVLDPLSTSSELGSTGTRAHKRISPDHSLRIGCYGNGESSLLDGALSDYQVWFGNFTADDAAYDYANPESLALNASGTALTESNLKLWYPMQDGHRGQQSYILDGANTGLVSYVVNSDFSTGTTGYSVSTPVENRGEITNPDGILRLTYDASYSGGNALLGPSVLVIGTTYKVKFRAKGTHATDFGSVGNNTNVQVSEITNPVLTTGWQDYEFLVTANSTNLRFYQGPYGSGGTTLDIDDITVQPINDKNHATTVFVGDELWDLADNNLSNWAAGIYGSSEAVIGGSNDGIKLTFGGTTKYVNGSYIALKDTSTNTLTTDLTVGRTYKLSGKFATDVAGATNAPRPTVWTSASNYASSPTVPATNLVTNGTMEADSGWSGWSSPASEGQSDEQAHNGTYSWKFIPAEAGDGIDSAAFTTVTGTTYLVSQWVYPAGTVCRVAFRRGGEGVIGYTENITGLTAGAWNKIEYQYTEVNGGTGAYVLIDSSTTTSGNFYVDDVVVTAFVEKEIEFTATNATDNTFNHFNCEYSATNEMIQIGSNANNSTFATGVGDWVLLDESGSNAAISHSTEDGGFVTINDTADNEGEGLKLPTANIADIEIGRSYTVLVEMKAASDTPGVRVQFGAHTTAAQTITTDRVTYAYKLTPTTTTHALLVYTSSTANIDILVYNVQVFPHCNLYVDDISIKEVGTASGWTDADQQLDIAQPALQSYNEMAHFGGFNDCNVQLGSEINTASNNWSLSFWLYEEENNTSYSWPIGKESNQNILTKNSSTRKLHYRDVSSAYHLLGDYTIPVGQWNHFVIAATGDTKMQAYINGVKYAENSDMTDTTLVLLYFMEGYSSNHFTAGIITEIAYYNTVLADADALDLYNDGKAKSALEASGSGGLVNYWRNNGLSVWEDLKGSVNATPNALVTETLLIPQGVDGSRDAQGFIMNRERNTSSLNIANPNDDDSGGAVAGRSGVVINNSPTVDITSDLTICGWIKRKDNNHSYNIIQKKTSWDSAGYGLYYHTGNDKWYVEYTDAAGNTAQRSDATMTIPLDEWYFICVTHDDSGNDVQYQASSSAAALTVVTHGSAKANIATNTEPILIGVGTGGSQASDSNNFSGQLDGFNIYNRTLDATEVLRNFKATKGSHRN